MRRALRQIVAVIAACLAAGLFIGAGAEAGESLAQRIAWPDGIQCAAKMIGLSIVPVLGLGRLMRHGAPTDRRRTAWLIGLASGAWGAFVFVFACPFNDPLYIAVWYGVGCGLVTLLARLLLPRLARW